MPTICISWIHFSDQDKDAPSQGQSDKGSPKVNQLLRHSNWKIITHPYTTIPLIQRTKKHVKPLFLQCWECHWRFSKVVTLRVQAESLWVTTWNSKESRQYARNLYYHSPWKQVFSFGYRCRGRGGGRGNDCSASTCKTGSKAQWQRIKSDREGYSDKRFHGESDKRFCGCKWYVPHARVEDVPKQLQNILKVEGMQPAVIIQIGTNDIGRREYSMNGGNTWWYMPPSWYRASSQCFW